MLGNPDDSRLMLHSRFRHMSSALHLRSSGLSVTVLHLKFNMDRTGIPAVIDPIRETVSGFTLTLGNPDSS